MRVPRPSLLQTTAVRRAATGVLAAGTLGVLSVAPAVAAFPAPHQLPATAGLTPSTSASTAGTRVAAHAVPPTVTDLSVPAVSPGDRQAVATRIAHASSGPDRTSLSGAVLVAHLRRPLTSWFSMVGVTWDGGTATADTKVMVRAHTGATWSHWFSLPVELTEGPAPSEDSSARGGTAPAWVGSARGVEVAVYSPTGATPGHLAVDEIDPGTSAYDTTALNSTAARTPTAATTGGSPRGSTAGTFPDLPSIITRRQWGADPRLGDACWAPRLGNTFKMVFIHHTAGSNHYSESESAAVVRGIYAFHTQSRGWCDIAYNFLVDRYGNVFEGRRGGIHLPVRGAHAGDYNVNTTGIALMGDFTSASPTRAMKRSLVQLVAWRMGTAYHGAYGNPTVHGTSFKRISGHRDAMSTTCPGQVVYDWLPTLRYRVATRLGSYRSPLEARWRALGGMHSRLGAVSIGEQVENGGRHTAFQTGRMYQSRGGSPHVLYHGAILRKYLGVGETRSHLGYPAGNVRSVANGTGKSASFAEGRIYSSRATGSTVLVRSAILKRFLRIGGAGGRLGFPEGRVHPTKTGSIAQFQHGTIAYDSSTHHTVVTYS